MSGQKNKAQQHFYTAEPIFVSPPHQKHPIQQHSFKAAGCVPLDGYIGSVGRSDKSINSYSSLHLEHPIRQHTIQEAAGCLDYYIISVRTVGQCAIGFQDHLNSNRL